MPIKAPKNKSFEPVPTGAHVARCYQIIHIGTVQEEYLGESKMLNKVRLSFELPTELRQFNDGEEKKPMAISKEFTLSFGEKANLRKFIEGLIGTQIPTDFDVESLVGKECLITIIHKAKKDGGMRADIASVSPLPKGMSCPPAINKPRILNYDHFDQDLFMTLPEFLKEKIVTSLEYKKLFGQDPVERGEVPF